MLLKNILRTICEQSQNFLCEDPDTVFKTDEDGNEIEIGFNDSKSYTFIVGKKFALVSASSENYHSGILWVANKAASIIDNDKNAMNAEELAAYMNKSSVVVTNPEEFYNEMTSKTGAFYKEVNQKAFRDNSRKIKGFVAGRYWIHKKIISFWNPQEEVLNVWDGIEDMMHKMHITDFDQYEIDWVERDNEHFKSLGKASKVKSKSVEKVAPLDKEKYLELLKKVHVATPEEKKKIMSQLGADVPSKASQIADKLGMTVAQYNHLLNINENNLSENILNEDPDNVILSVDDWSGDPDDTVGYDTPDAYSFIVGKKYGFMAPTAGLDGITHDDLLGHIRDVIELIENGETQANAHDYFKGYRINVWNIENFYNDVENGVREISELDDDNNNSRDIPGFISGRYWTDKKIISFWNSKSSVLKFWSSIKQMMQHARVGDFDRYFVDWIERTEKYENDGELIPLKTVSDAQQKKDDPIKDIDPEKLKNILKKLHLASPQEKRELLNKIGANVPSKASRIADKLGMTVAQFNALMNVNEVIKEDPDHVLFPDDDGDVDYTKDIYFDDGDSYTFICGKNYAFVSKTNKNTHYEMLKTVFNCIEFIIEDGNDKLKIEKAFIDENIHVTNIEAFYDEIYDEKINYGDDKRKSYLVDFYYDNRDDIPDEAARNVPGFLSGRYWKDEKIISFWNKRSVVIKNWAGVGKMMDYMNINDFSSYFVDWVERTIEYNKNSTLSPLTPVKSVKTDKPAAKIKDKEYKELLKKLHAASPEEKKRIFKKLGADVPSKASRIADKLGMTVAQFNHLTNVNENN